MAQNAELPIIYKNFSGGDTPEPNPRPVTGHRAVLLTDSRCFGSHNFQIVPARLGEGPPPKIREGTKRLKFGAISDNYRL